MSDNLIPVLKYLFRGQIQVLAEALATHPGLQAEEYSSPNELASYLSSVPSALVMASVADKSDLVQLATLVKMTKKVAKDSAIKIVVFQFFRDKEIEKAIAKLGILDLVDPNIQTKALKFKLDFWIKSLKGQMKNGPQKKTEKPAKENEGKSEKSSQDGSSIPVWQEAFPIEDDIWILKNDNDCKKVLSKWLIRLLGPGPSIAQWNEYSSGVWRFDFKPNEKEIFISSEGSWYFAGDQKPDFVWKENLWLISGSHFELYFKNGDKVYSRIKCVNRVLTICKNSLQAKTKEEIIIESFNREMVFKKEATVLSDLEGKNATDNLGGPLDGKGNTDQLENGPLQGKNSQADQFSNLTGKTGGANNFSSENPFVDFDPLSEGDNLERKRKDGTYKKHYHGHNEAEVYEAANLEGKNSGIDKINSHYELKNSPKNAARPKAHSGPINYDEENEKPSARVLDFSSAKQNKIENAQEADLDKITQDASVVSYLVHDNNKIFCRLDDFFENTVMFHMEESQLISPSSKIRAEMSFNTMGKEFKVKLDGSVQTVESDGEGKIFLSMQIPSDNMMTLESFMKLFQLRQKNVNEFFKIAKGE